MGQFLNGNGKIAIISSAIETENNNYYVQMREQGFTDFLKVEYPQIVIVSRVESFEDPQITYEKRYSCWLNSLICAASISPAAA